MPFLRGPDHRLGERMARVDLRAGRVGQHLRGLPILMEGNDIGDDRPAEGERAGLVEDDRVDAAGLLQVRATLIRMPRRAPLPIAALMAVGVANPTAHGQATSSMVMARRTSPVATSVTADNRNEAGTKRREKFSPTV